MSARARERGDRVEWRLVCASLGNEGHRGHAWIMSERTGKTEATRAQLVADRNADPALRTISYRGCLPLHAECRYVSEWTTDTDRVEGLGQ